MATCRQAATPGSVGISLVVATFASYVALDLTKRGLAARRGVALGWWIGGSVAMGTGIWCMHFDGILAFTLPIEFGFSRCANAKAIP